MLQRHKLAPRTQNHRHRQGNHLLLHIRQHQAMVHPILRNHLPETNHDHVLKIQLQGAHVLHQALPSSWAGGLPSVLDGSDFLRVVKSRFLVV